MSGVLIGRGLATQRHHSPVYTEGEVASANQGERPQRDQLADTLVLDFQPPELGDNTCLLLKPDNFRICVAARVD